MYGLWDKYNLKTHRSTGRAAGADFQHLPGLGKCPPLPPPTNHMLTEDKTYAPVHEVSYHHGYGPQLCCFQ